MVWNYSGDPSKSLKDEVRFLTGDTCQDEPLVQDEEIRYALAKHGDNTMLAGALVLRSLAARFSREASASVGGVSYSGATIAEAFNSRADELDPSGVTSGSSALLPVFGGLTYTGKEILDSDTDAVQPIFRKGQFDNIEGGSDFDGSERDD